MRGVKEGKQAECGLQQIEQSGLDDTKCKICHGLFSAYVCRGWFGSSLNLRNCFCLKAKNQSKD